MAKKKRKIFKILWISTASILAVLIFVSIAFNYYLKKSILQAMDETLNAEVKIDKVRYRLFSSTIDIYGLELKGKKEFKNDILLDVTKTSIKLEDYDADNNKIILEHFNLDSPNMKNITSESGDNCWENILKETKKDSTSIEEDDFEFFCNNISITNASIVNEDRSNGKTQSISDLNIEANLWSEDTIIGVDYKIDSDFSYVELDGESNTYTIGLKGTMFFEGKEIRSYNNLQINNTPIELNLTVNYDSTINKESNINLIVDFSKVYFDNNIDTDGSLHIDFGINGIFDSIVNPEIELSVFATELKFENKTTKELLYCDFVLDADYLLGEERFVRARTTDFFMSLVGDTISGDIDFEFNDTECLASSDMKGEIDLSNLKNVFGDPFLNVGGLLTVFSDLNGLLNKESNNLLGSFNLNYENINQDSLVGLNSMSIAFDKSNFQFNLDLITDFFAGKSKLTINDIRNIYLEKETKITGVTHLFKVDIPITKNRSFSFPEKLDEEGGNWQFPKSTSTKHTIIVDSLIIGNKCITEINCDLIYAPGKIGFENLNLSVSEGRILGDFVVTENHNGDIFIRNNIDIKDLDLSYLSNEEIEMSGLVNFEGENRICAIDDSTSLYKNQGRNKLLVQNFKFETDLLRDYSIDEEYIYVDSLEFDFYIEGDELKLLPTKFNVNEVEVAGLVSLNFMNETMYSDVLLNVPDKYLSSKVKIFISMFSKELEQNNSRRTQKENYSLYQLNISGRMRNLNYKIYEY